MKTLIQVPRQQGPHLLPIETATATTGAGQHDLRPILLIRKLDQFATGTFNQVQIRHLERAVFNREVEQTTAKMKDMVAFSPN